MCVTHLTHREAPLRHTQDMETTTHELPRDVALEARERELLIQLVQFYGPLSMNYGGETASTLYDLGHERLGEIGWRA